MYEPRQRDKYKHPLFCRKAQLIINEILLKTKKHLDKCKIEGVNWMKLTLHLQPKRMQLDESAS